MTPQSSHTKLTSPNRRLAIGRRGSNPTRPSPNPCPPRLSPSVASHPRESPPQANSKAEAKGRRRRRSGGGGGHGVACEPLPGREGDPLPLLPILPRQRPREVPSAPPSPLSLSRVLDPIWRRTAAIPSFRREFVKKNYGDIKARNPSLPVLIRECSGVEPQLWARYGTRSFFFSSLLHGIRDPLSRFLNFLFLYLLRREMLG